MGLEGQAVQRCLLLEPPEAEKALKAFLFFKGKRTVFEHSIVALSEACAKKEKAFEKFVAYGASLDRYYIPTRYPNGLPYPALPATAFKEEEAKEAIKMAGEMVDLVNGLVI